MLVDKDVGAAVRPRSPRSGIATVPIEMAYFEGMSYRQVALALEEPEGP